MSKTIPEPQIIITQATAPDLPAVVELCMQVEAQHEAYWPLRWQRRGDLRDGYLGWLTRRLAEPRMLIAVARVSPESSVLSPETVGTQDSRLTAQDSTNPQHSEIAGMILVTIEKEIPIYAHSEYAFVQDMAVIDPYRRHGIAQRLLAYAADWARPQGLNQLRLMVANQNPAARAAFEKAGFRPTYQEMTLPLLKDQT